MEIRLKQARTSKKLTLKEVANLIQVSESAVSQYERGKSVPSNSVIRLFCEKLSISEQWLRTGEGEMEEPDVMADLIARYRLGPAGQALLRAVARAFAELDEETCNRVLDDVLAELTAFNEQHSAVNKDTVPIVVPQSPADSANSSVG